jgi:ubiquitin-protein ligase
LPFHKAWHDGLTVEQAKWGIWSLLYSYNPTLPAQHYNKKIYRQIGQKVQEKYLEFQKNEGVS